MSRTIIYDRHGWQLISYGNGLSYAIRCMIGGKWHSALIQGDDAADFRADFDACDENTGRHPVDLFSDYDSVLEPEDAQTHA